MIEIIKGDFFAGEVKTFLIQGEYVEVLEALYPIDVAMMDRSGAQLSVMRNAEASYFSRPGKYEVVQVTSASAQTVRLFIGSGDAGTRRTSGQVQVIGTVGVTGDVSVIDGGKARSLEGGAFAWAHGSAAVAANYSRLQLFNPVESGKNTIVKAFKITTAAATTVFVHAQNAQHTSNVGALPNSKYPGGVVPLSQARFESSGALIVSPIMVDYINAAGIGTMALVMQEPVVLRPGWGLTIENATINQRIDASFEWFEQPV